MSSPSSLSPSSHSARKRKKSKNPQSRRHSRIFDEPPPSIFPSGEEIIKLIAVLAIATFVAVVCNYVFGFLGRKPTPFCDTSAEDSVDFASDFCRPCPVHGLCSNGKFDCIHGYKKVGMRCVEDAQVYWMANKFSYWLKQHVCEAYARTLCGQTGRVWFEKVEILQMLDEYKQKEKVDLKDEAFILMKKMTIETLESSLEMRTILDGISKEFKCPDYLAELHKPFVCTLCQWVYKHMLFVLCVTVILGGVLVFSLKIRQKRYLSSRAEQLYEQICEIMEEKSTAVEGLTGNGEPWVVFSWLRDGLLLPKERKNTRLWKRVEELIREDSRIDQYPKLIKGEPKVVLEWQVEGGSLSAKKKSKTEASKTKANTHLVQQSQKTPINEKMMN